MWPRGRGRNLRGSPRLRGGPPRASFRGGTQRGFPRGASRGGFFNKPPRSMNNHYRGGKKFDRPPVQKQHVAIERLNEPDIGVTEYISSLEGFNGILKARYSDFQVNEIDKEGVVAKLTNLNVPVDPEPEPVEEDDEGVMNRYRIEQLPIETWDKMHKMVQSNDKTEVVEIDVTNTSKSDRTEIHEAVKTVFGTKIVGSTVTVGDRKLIIFKKYNKHDRIDLREKWPATRPGEYVYFLVHKEFTDTIEANIKISECLQMRAASFCYAGVKDRRAKTTQWFCVRKVEPARIVEKTKGLKNIYVGNFCYKKETLKLGQLKGNRFRIAVRDVTADNELVEKALESLRDNGFINYYGLQRFGNSKEIPTHTIGIELLRGNFAQAVQLILKPRKYEQMYDIADAKKVYAETNDAVEACSKLKRSRNKCIEGKLLAGLAKHDPNDFVNALENVPRNMRLLYIHAYQSLVWNIMTSRRIKEFGLKPMVGDIIVDDDQNSDQVWESVETDITDKFDPELEVNKEVKMQQIKVKLLTESDLPNYTIYDVVLPLPGYDITYPDNVVKDWYKEYLEKDGLSLNMPKQKVKTYTLSGAYRKIVERVTEMSWKFMNYDDPSGSLIRSDIEELRKKPEPKDKPDGKHKALVVDFCLSSSCYATMALRELMKINTSWDGTKEEAKNDNKEKNEEKTEAEIPTDQTVTDKPTTSENNGKDVSQNKKGTTQISEINTECITDKDTDETKVVIKKVVVVTPEEIQNAKKEFIRKEIAELEDEIWAVMEDETKGASGKRKADEDTNETDNKKTKSEDFLDFI